MEIRRKIFFFTINLHLPLTENIYIWLLGRLECCSYSCYWCCGITVTLRLNIIDTYIQMLNPVHFNLVWKILLTTRSDARMGGEDLLGTLISWNWFGSLYKGLKGSKEKPWLNSVLSPVMKMQSDHIIYNFSVKKHTWLWDSTFLSTPQRRHLNKQDAVSGRKDDDTTTENRQSIYQITYFCWYILT